MELHRGTWRVHGVLAVSRSIGDAHLKDWVLGEPETTILPLTDDLEYLILASDGLWDEVYNTFYLYYFIHFRQNYANGYCGWQKITTTKPL